MGGYLASALVRSAVRTTSAAVLTGLVRRMLHCNGYSPP
jgi:hypothetical protein